MALPKLEVKGASKSFPGVKALIKADFHLNPGEIVSLVGENGAGKSTLINVISGQILPDEGDIYIDGKKARIETPTDAITLGVSLVPQELNLIPQLSVAENIYLGTRKVKSGLVPMIDWATLRREAEEILASLDAKLDVMQYVESMSVADQQMVQIARALCLGADVLIFDEPTACLTINETAKLLQLIRRFKAQGKSILFVSHHLDEVIEISDRVAVMRDGVLVENLEKGELTVPRLIKGMVGREVERGEVLRRKPCGDVILKVENLSRAGEFRNISFEVQKGEIFGIAGLVGAGRTELVNTIYGASKPGSGAIWFDGERLSLRGPHNAIAKGMGYVPEERRKFGILPTMTIRENLTIANMKRIFRFPTMRKKTENEMVKTYCEQVRVKMVSPEGFLTRLSGGNQQKVIVARWLAVGCKMLIVDEPTRGIDVFAKHEIHKLMRQCADEGVTVLAVSSELEELINICNRILIMHEGEQKGIVDAESMTPEQILHIALA